MALVTDPGSPSANGYVSVAFVTTHHADRGNAAWTEFSSQEQEQAIVRATDYTDKRFGKRYRGIRQAKDQALEWPRLDAFDDDGFLLTDVDQIPRGLQKAVAEYALRALLYNVLAPDAPLPVPQQDLTDSEAEREDAVVTGEITRKRERVGPLEEENWYQTASQTTARNLGAGARGVQSSLLDDFNIPQYPEADLWIEELLRSSMNIRLARGD